MIIVPSLIQLPQEIGLQAIHAQNKVKQLARVFIYMAICSLAISFILAKPMGATGIGLSVFLAYILRSIGMDVILYRDLGINIKNFFANSFGKLAFPLLLCLLVGFGISKISLVKGWLGLIVNGVAFALCYFFTMYFIAMNIEEKGILLNPIKRILKKKN